MKSAKLTAAQEKRVRQALDQVPFANLTISYLRPLLTGRARATARVLRVGRRLIAVSAEVSSDDGSLAATALSTYIRLAHT